MIAPGAFAFIRTGDLRSEAAGLGAGGLTFAVDDIATTTSFRLLDTFDGQIAAKGLLLVLTPDALVLLGGDAVIRQVAAEPDYLARMPIGPVTQHLAGIVSPLRTLMTLAPGSLTHGPLRVLDDYEKTHLRGNVWILEADGRCVSLGDLRALRGYDKSLKRLATAFEAPGAALSAFDACARLRGEDPRLIGKVRMRMTPDETAFGAANNIIATQLAVVRRNEAGVMGDLDIEFLHDYRVALRRVRSVISLFKDVYAPDQTAELKMRFSAVMARTGALRDLDVYLLEQDRYMDLVPEAFRSGIAKLFASLAARRDTAQAELAAYLRSDDYAREITALARLFDKPKRLAKGPQADRNALHFARKLIWKRYRKVCAIAREIGELTPDETVHELRIHCKKLRYLMEFFGPLFGAAEIKPLIKSLKRLQNNLGAFNDYSVQQEALQTMTADLSEMAGTDAVEIAASIGALIIVLHQKQLEERARVTASFAAFDAPETQARFRALFRPEGDAT